MLIKKVAILGSGVMGAQLAAMFANYNIKSLLFDLNKKLSAKAIDNLKKIKPPPLKINNNINLIKSCSYDEDINQLINIDWIIEAVVEDIDIKVSVYNKIINHIKSSAIISSNTSGISLENLVLQLPITIKKRFLIAHFFNPPRYMHLLELVNGPLTSKKAYKVISSFGEKILQKKIVHAKDTPNFIGNRIGIFSLMNTIHKTIKQNLNPIIVDQLTGIITGRSKSATFRTADIIGLDILKSVSLTTYNLATDDESRLTYKIPRLINKLINKNRLGQKTKCGFYKKDKENILKLNLKSLNYEEFNDDHKYYFVKLTKIKNLKDRIDYIKNDNHYLSTFFWEISRDLFLYSANRIPEISNNIINIDNAMKWGFSWGIGPFEIWDLFGLQYSFKRMNKEKTYPPKWINVMIEKGIQKFYNDRNGKKSYWCIIDEKDKNY